MEFHIVYLVILDILDSRLICLFALFFCILKLESTFISHVRHIGRPNGPNSLVLVLGI